MHSPQCQSCQQNLNMGCHSNLLKNTFRAIFLVSGVLQVTFCYCLQKRLPLRHDFCKINFKLTFLYRNKENNLSIDATAARYPSSREFTKGSPQSRRNCTFLQLSFSVDLHLCSSFTNFLAMLGIHVNLHAITSIIVSPVTCHAIRL